MLLRHLRGTIRHVSSTPKAKRSSKANLSLYSSEVQKNINTILSFHKLGQRHKNSTAQIINPALCEQALDKLDLSVYKNACIVDMNPGIGVWSAALYDRVQPRQHILLEPRSIFHPALEEVTRTRPNAHIVQLDGYNWDTYNMLLADSPPSPPFPINFPRLDLPNVPPEDGINTGIIFTGRIPATENGIRLIGQLFHCCGVGGWLYQFGRVRTLLWTPETLRERYSPPIVQARGRGSVVAQTVSQVHVVVAQNTVRTGKGFQMLQSEKKQYIPKKVRPVPDETLTSEPPKTKTKPKEDTSQKIFKKMETEMKKLATIKKERSEPIKINVSKAMEALYPDEDEEVESEEDLETRKAEFDEYEKSIPLISKSQMFFRKNSISDENRAELLLQDGRPLLAHEARKFDPVPLESVEGNIEPQLPMALLDFEPVLLDPWLRDPDIDLRNRRWQLFDWLVKSMFVRRASSVSSALRTLGPGAEHVLAELSPEEAVDPDKSVRLLFPHEFVNIAKGWERWPFKPEQAAYLNDGSSWSYSGGGNRLTKTSQGEFSEMLQNKRTIAWRRQQEKNKDRMRKEESPGESNSS